MGKTQGRQVLGGGLSGIKRSRLGRKLSNSTSGLWIFNRRAISYHFKEGHKLSPCAVFLYQLANTTTYYTTANLFGIEKSTIWEINVQVCNVIVQVLLLRYIYLPQSAREIQEMIDEGQPYAGLPQVVACVAGCHIPIKAHKTTKRTMLTERDFIRLFCRD